MHDENFIVEIPDAFVSIGIIIALFSAGIMLGFTMFTEQIPHILFYVVLDVLFWLVYCLIFRVLTYKVINKN